MNAANRWKSRLYRKLFAANLLLIALVALLPVSIIVIWQPNSAMKQTRDQLRDAAVMLPPFARQAVADDLVDFGLGEALLGLRGTSHRSPPSSLADAAPSAGSRSSGSASAAALGVSS